MENIEQRVRRVDPNTLTDEQAKVVEDMLSKKLKEIVEIATVQANRYFNVYGVKVSFSATFAREAEIESALKPSDFSMSDKSPKGESLEVKKAKPKKKPAKKQPAKKIKKLR